MRLHLLTIALLVASNVRVDAQPALDDVTPCSVAVRAFASKDDAQMRKLGQFLDDIFERLDEEHTKYGESGILSDGLTSTLELVVAGFCAQQPGSTISLEATKAYQLMRRMKVKTEAEP